MATIKFYSQKIRFKLPNTRKTANWLKNVCLLEGHDLASLTYVFCSDEYLKKLNKQYLSHSTYTDILSFDYTDEGKIQGEIYISIPRVKDNARIFHQAFDLELRRVLVHGLLHLMGYLDKQSSQKAQMRRKEEACLSLWK